MTASARGCARRTGAEPMRLRARVDHLAARARPRLNSTSRRSSRSSRPSHRTRHAASTAALHRAAHAARRRRGAICRCAAAPPREWAERIRASLAALGWPGDAVRGSEPQQTVQRFNELLNEFGELALAARVMSRERALQIFSELATRTRFRPASGDALVTVTGRLEDPVVHYEGIWVAGMDATSWPEPVQARTRSSRRQRSAPPAFPAAKRRGTHVAAARALMARTARRRRMSSRLQRRNPG